MSSQSFVQFLLPTLLLLAIAVIQAAFIHAVGRFLLDEQFVDSALYGALTAGIAVFTAAQSDISSHPGLVFGLVAAVAVLAHNASSKFFHRAQAGSGDTSVHSC